jgi:hypothetical protein
MPGIMMNSFSSGSSLSSQWRRQRRVNLLSLSSTGMRKDNNDETGTQKCTTIRSEIRVRDRLGPYNSDKNINGSMNGNNNRRYLYEKPNYFSVPFISPASSFSVPGRYSGRGGGGGGSYAMQYQYQWQEFDQSDGVNNSHDGQEEGPWGHFVDL